MSSTQEQVVGPPHVHHMDPVTAYSAAKFGMWLFLATEILLFSVMFVAFALFRYMHLEEFAAASALLDWRMGATNTAVLIFSSFTAAMAVDAAQHGNNKRVTQLFGISIVCGFIFLVVKYFEYSGKMAHGLFPGYSDHGMTFNDAEFISKYSVFFGLYYCMTGLHALHVIIGMGLLGWVVTLSMKGRFCETYYTPVEIGALYWHLVDLIWIYLFPLLYLVG